MHTVELLELARATAERLGYNVRQEWLGGVGGGACQVAGKKCIFLDAAFSPIQQLDQLVQALREDAALYVIDLPDSLRHCLGVPKAS